MTLQLQGKTALVTGGAVGIGQEISLELARQGADVVVHYSQREREEKSAIDLVDRIRSEMKCAATRVFGDFSNLRHTMLTIGGAIGRIEGMKGTLDILVNNAGITLDCPISELTEAHVLHLYKVNAMAPLFLIQQAIPHLRKSGTGAIVNISSIHSFGGIPGHAVYAGTKGAINAMTRELAIELARYHIRVNAVSPGGIEVPRQYELNPNHNPQEFGKLVPLGRIGMPLDVAKAVAFLASDDAAYITGQILCVDGGATAVPGLGDLHAREPDTPLDRQPYLQ